MRGFACLLVFSLSTVVRADDRPTILELRSFLYGDNTEFLSNPYREGETLLGAHLRLDAALPIGKSSHFRLGVQTDSRAGDSQVFRKVWPVIALEVRGSRDTFVFGTLKSGAFGRETWQGLWPDESGPHGLVPPLQVDTLTMARPYEAGLQWLQSRDGWRHDVWIAWQKLNTEQHRERFDVGAVEEITLARARVVVVSALFQGHIVHEGGQLFHTGSVGDSVAGGPGIKATWFVGRRGYLQTELMVLFSKHNPDRGNHARPDYLNGRGRLVRVSYERGDWRAAYLRWDSRDFLKWESDSNYGASNYDEFSMARRFGVGINASILTAGRLYRIDGSWDYSYRVAASVRFAKLLGGSQ